jgi:GDPmannose 4,6-dehydratase
VIATGESHSVKEFVAAAFAAAGVEDWPERVHVDPSLVRPADAAEQAGDSRRARTALGWEPTKSFDEIVATMVEADVAEARAQG